MDREGQAGRQDSRRSYCAPGRLIRAVVHTPASTLPDGYTRSSPCWLTAARPNARTCDYPAGSTTCRLPLSARNPPEKHSPWVSNGGPLSSPSNALNSLVGCPHCRTERIAHEQHTVGHCMADQRTARIAPRLPATCAMRRRLQSKSLVVGRSSTVYSVLPDNCARRVWRPN